MKKLFLLLVLPFSFLAFAQYTLPTASPRQTIDQQFSLSKVSVEYGRPAIKGRKIFGDLVPYNKIWRAGANSATKITFGQNVNFGGKEVPAGTYGLFVNPSEKEWKIILNKDAQQWGAFAFDEKLNIAEITVPVQKSAEKQEYFLISLNPVDLHSLELVMSWDNVNTTVPISVAKPEAAGKIMQKLTEIKQIEKESAAKK